MDFQDLRAGICTIKQAQLTPVLAMSHLTELLYQFIARVDRSSIQACLESNERYHRQRLSQSNDNFQMVLAAWKPYSCSSIHDHNDTTGAVVTLVGTTVETKYERVAHLGQYSFLHSSQPQTLDGKTVSPILPEHSGLQLHAMHNPHTTWAATLHVYLHPLATFNTYHTQVCDLYSQTRESLWFDREEEGFSAVGKR